MWKLKECATFPKAIAAWQPFRKSTSPLTAPIARAFTGFCREEEKKKKAINGEDEKCVSWKRKTTGFPKTHFPRNFPEHAFTQMASPGPAFSEAIHAARPHDDISNEVSVGLRQAGPFSCQLSNQPLFQLCPSCLNPKPAGSRTGALTRSTASPVNITWITPVPDRLRPRKDFFPALSLQHHLLFYRIPLYIHFGEGGDTCIRLS